MTPLTVVTWRWEPPVGYRTQFSPETVNTLRKMVARHYPAPHRFVCVTDDRHGLDADIEVVQPWNDFTNVPSPSGPKNPSCYRRLRAFHPEVGAVLGDRFVSLDLDIVLTGNVQALWDRPEDFVIWGDTNPRTFYNGSMFLMTAGARPQVWAQFDPSRSPARAKAAGHFGSDQGWISYCLGPNETKWTTADGVYSFRNHIQPKGMAKLPSDARVVVFHGEHKPWGRYPTMNCPWIRRFYQ